jgi:hypothetical protein
VYPIGSGGLFSLKQELIDKLDADLKYAIEVEGKMKVEDIENYDEVGENDEDEGWSRECRSM